MKTQKSKKQTSYSILSNVMWMVKLAWQTSKAAPILCLVSAILEILLQVTNLYIAPGILHQVEIHASLSCLLLTIGAFTAALFLLMGLKEYVRDNTTCPFISVRTAIIEKIGEKCNTTAYSNTLDTSFIKLRDKAFFCTSTNSQSTERIWHTLTFLLQNTGGFLVFLTILSPLNPWILALMVFTCVLGFLIFRYTSNWKYRHREEEAQCHAKLAYIQNKSQSITMAKDIRIFGLQNWLDDISSSIQKTYMDFLLRCEKMLLLGDLADVFFTIARNGIAYVYLLHLALSEDLSVSAFLLYFTAISTFTTWVNGILQQCSDLHKESLDISSLRTFLDYPEPFRFQNGKPIPPKAPYELRLEQVSYRYPGADRDTIHQMNLTLHPGEKLAIVGLNGAGKTTLVKLLCGLLDPTKGRVLLNGQDIRDFNRQDYYALFSAVFQNYSLLDVTLAENIAQDYKDINEKRIWNCLEKAGLTQMVQQLQKGLATHTGREVYLDGVLFSGGQTQRLMLARALYKNSPILLLDEPTAALDPLAENDIYLKYHEMTEGKTSLFISHRLASTRFCDRILYLEHGAILEEGTHEELLQAGGAYAQLFDTQSRYYQEGRDF